MKKIISFIQVFAILMNMYAQLPESVDNSKKIFFYEIFDQKPLSGENYQSCAQAAGVAYTFCYEINRHRNLNADSPENQYPQTYTWNYMNCADYNTLSYVHDGWDIIKNNGCPNMVKWGTGNFWDYLMWMDGYEKYLDGIKNRVISNSSITVNQSGGLDQLKQWLYNRNQGGNQPGGLGVFSKPLTRLTPLGTVGEPGPFEGDSYIQYWDTGLDHAMTIVGYNDNVPCGLFGNGALKIANSWDVSWGNYGFVWLPYELAKEDGLSVKIIDDVDYREPAMVAKIRMKHECRNKIRVGIFISDQPDANPPGQIQYYNRFIAMNPNMLGTTCGGGCRNLDGSVNTEPGNYVSIDIVFDISEYIEDYNQQSIPSLKIVLGVQEKGDGNDEYEGVVEDFSIIDYRVNPQGFEVYSHDKDIDIVNNGMTNLTVWYFQLPPQINQQTGSEWDHPCIVKGTSTIESGTIADIHGDYLDLYDDANLTVESGAALNLSDNITVSTQRGDVKRINDTLFIASTSVENYPDNYMLSEFVIDTAATLYNLQVRKHNIPTTAFARILSCQIPSTCQIV